ncbi:hypothetical protein BSU04_43255 [Caballeronia sordidicola]|uniref:Uncharacterized protein n=1 Tax=Caballeronia sordidicola TaxID=196367 RepID=A0A226WLV0_CABSO|nr:hypothetical protein BSU04_43255 [Caballeronia sordidicola]
MRELTLQSLGEKIEQAHLRAVTNVACIYLTAREGWSAADIGHLSERGSAPLPPNVQRNATLGKRAR